MTKIICECGEMYNTSYNKRHILSKVHQSYIENLSDTLEKSEKNDTINESDDEVVDDDEIVDDNFLDELNNQNYIIEDEETVLKLENLQLKLRNLNKNLFIMMKLMKKMIYFQINQLLF